MSREEITLHLLQERHKAGFEVLSSRKVSVDITTPLDAQIQSAFHEEINLLEPVVETQGEPNKFILYLCPAAPASWDDLEPVLFWENEAGEVCFPLVSTGHLTIQDLARSVKVGYLTHKPTEIYCLRVWGLGGGGDALEILEWLLYSGAAWVVTYPLNRAWNTLRTLHLTRKAKIVAGTFDDRHIYSARSLRLWARTREEWTTAEGVKKLGVDSEVVESIFHALGYKKRYQDQTWRLGVTEEFTKRQEAWIEGEPSGNPLAHKPQHIGLQSPRSDVV